MQINLYSKALKNGILSLGWILFFLCLWCKGCSSSQPQIASVTVPEITNTLPTAQGNEIVHVPIEIPKWYKDTKAEKKYLKDISEAEERIIAYQEEIDNMHSEYKNSDSTKQAELYRLATELKKFESNFEDEYLKLTINGIIAGNQVKEISPIYTIKERKIEVPIQQVKFRLLGSVGLGNTMTFEKPLFNANLGFQNAKGNILRIGYDSEKRIFVGYDFSIFKITR
jgi:uncharacterized small protein (DUF1192 family)